MNLYDIVDPEELDKVEGLSPEKEKHQFFLDFYQVVATIYYIEFLNQVQTSTQWNIF